MEHIEYGGRSWSPDCSSSDRLWSEPAARHGPEAREGNWDLRSSPSFGRGFESPSNSPARHLVSMFRPSEAADREGFTPRS